MVHHLKGSTDLATHALTAGVTHIRDVNLGFSILGQRLATKLKDIQTARQYVQQQEKSVTPAARQAHSRPKAVSKQNWEIPKKR